MAGHRNKILDTLNHLPLGDVERLAPKLTPELKTFPLSRRVDAKILENRWQSLGRLAQKSVILPGEGVAWAEGHIENAIGCIQLPVGLAGPLRVNGLFAQGDYPIPMATTEAALVASYHRGCGVLNAAGGVTSVLLAEGLTRSPAFVFTGIAEAGRFVAWVSNQWEAMVATAGGTTRHGVLREMTTHMEGCYVWLTLEYSTGDACGQNMVTISSQAVCEFLVESSPIKPQRWYVEGNMSGDKKASAQAFLSVRGKKVSAEAKISAELVEKHLRATPNMLIDYWRLSALGGIQSGTMGVQGHFANGLAALYLATGQDAACVAESAIGVTHFEKMADGGLYAAVTLPGIMVGTVGGGTGLPSQRACLELMGLAGLGKAKALAEVCAGLLVAGELSIIAALAAGHFTQAHRKLARRAKSV